MKRTFAKRGLMSLVAGFFLFGFMLLSAVRAEAQANWVSSDEAKARLLQEINNVYHPIIASGQPGQQAHDNAMAVVTYYKAIYSLINDGQSVSAAVGQGMSVLATGVHAGFAPNQYVAQNQAQGVVADVTDLLTD